MQRFRVNRTKTGPNTTLGVLWKEGAPGIWSRLCETLEDQDGRPGKGRIPAGEYQLLLVTPEMQPDAKRNKRYGHLSYWRGALVLLDVPGFSGIEIHAGDGHEDTLGCLLLGEHPYRDGAGDYRFQSWGDSREVFLRTYPEIAEPLVDGVECRIEVVDP